MFSSVEGHITTTKVTNHASIEFTLRQCPLSFGLFYRPPSSADSLTEFEDFLAPSLPPSSNLLFYLATSTSTCCPPPPPRKISYLPCRPSICSRLFLNPLESPPPPRPLLTMSMSPTLLSSTHAKHFHPLDLPTTPVFL